MLTSDVIKYGLKRLLQHLEYTKSNIGKQLAQLFHQCIFHFPQSIQTIVRYPLALEGIHAAFDLKSTLLKMLPDRISRNESYECAWILWLVILLKIKIDPAGSILGNAQDCPSLILIAYCAKIGLANSVSLSESVNRMAESGFYGPHWLLFYEAHVNPRIDNLLAAFVGAGHTRSSEKFLQHLTRNGVTFFDPDDAISAYNNLKSAHSMARTELSERLHFLDVADDATETEKIEREEEY